MAKAFFIARDRTFEEDPRFGLVVLSEIAARALSPGINDPGTAINIIGAFVRLFALWVTPPDRSEEKVDVKYDRVRVAPLQLADMFDDAFTAISRDGAGTVEVVTRLQKAFVALATISNPALEAAARHHSALALARAELSLKLPSEIAPIRELSASLR